MKMERDDGRSIYSRASKALAKSQQNYKELKEQRIFDVYMKAPYRLMDRSKQKRQQNRQVMRHLQFIHSPSKDILQTQETSTRDKQYRIEQLSVGYAKRVSLQSSHQNLLNAADTYSQKRFKQPSPQKTVNKKQSKTSL